MALVNLSQQDDYDIANTDQDCRGWTAYSTTGEPIGKVTEMVIDTDAERVHSLIVEGGAKIPVEDIALRDGKVIVRGAGTQTTTETTTTTQVSQRGTGDSQRAVAGTHEVALPVIEEQIKIGKREVNTGGVRVRQSVTETPVEETVTLREEHVNVERRPVDRAVDDANMSGAFKEGVIEVTETAEEAVVSKQARVVEEVVVNREAVEREETIRDTVRRTDVDVEQLDANRASNKN